MDHKSQYINNFQQHRHPSPTSEDCSILPPDSTGVSTRCGERLPQFLKLCQGEAIQALGCPACNAGTLKALGFIFKSRESFNWLAQNNYSQILLGSTSWLEPLSGHRPLSVSHLWRHFPAPTPPPGIPVSPHHPLSKQHPLEWIFPIYFISCFHTKV